MSIWRSVRWAAIGLGIVLLFVAVVAANATWKPEFATSPPAVREWFKGAITTPAARQRLGIYHCCEQAERLRTKFVLSAGHDWSYYPNPECVTAGCELRPLPNDIVHEDPIRALDPADDGLPEFQAMRREGVLFIWNGNPSCFWPPESGI